MIPDGDPITHRRLRARIGGPPVGCRALVRFLGIGSFAGRTNADGTHQLAHVWHYRCDRCGVVWQATPLGGDPLRIRCVEFTLPGGEWK